MNVTTYSPNPPRAAGAGRPASDDPRNRTVTARLTASEHARFVAAAKTCGLRVPQAARAAVFAFTERAR